MLIGEHKHILDPKKRVSLPAKFRKEMGNEVIITRGLDNCLFVYTVAEFAKIAENLSHLPLGKSDNRSYGRLMLSGGMETEIDSLGRILIPDFLKKFAGLNEKVVIIGVHSRLEIWDEDRWMTYKEGIERDADKLAEKLGEVGMI